MSRADPESEYWAYLQVQPRPRKTLTPAEALGAALLATLSGLVGVALGLWWCWL